MKELAILTMIIGLCLVVFSMLPEPTPEQIAKCVETTNYTTERCEVEMTR